MRKIKKLTYDELAPTKTRQEWIEFFEREHKLGVPREKSAEKFPCTKYTLRRIADHVGISLKQGRPKLQIKFKGEQ